MINTTNVKVPAKYESKIEKIRKNENGYWVYATNGYCFEEDANHLEHSNSQNDVLVKVRKLKPCKCEKCVAETRKQLDKWLSPSM